MPLTGLGPSLSPNQSDSKPSAQGGELKRKSDKIMDRVPERIRKKIRQTIDDFDDLLSRLAEDVLDSIDEPEHRKAARLLQTSLLLFDFDSESSFKIIQYHIKRVRELAGGHSDVKERLDLLQNCVDVMSEC
jgi:hypothetical protein